jgi:cysteine synthase
VEITRLNPNPRVAIYAKLEGFNPSGSVKDRIALRMLEEAERRGDLKRGQRVIEPTSGNTGIAVAMVAALKGHGATMVMPKSMSIERRAIMKAFGADVVLVEESGGDETIKAARRLAEENGYFMPNQYENEDNVLAHYHGTGAEILKQVPKADVFIAGIGTGGTITGVGKRLRKANPEIEIVGVEPRSNANIQGLRNLGKYVPPILDENMLDEKILVGDRSAFEFTRKLAAVEGILAGPSSGAALHVALQKARKMKSGVIVTIFPDRGEKYLSTGLFKA